MATSTPNLNLTRMRKLLATDDHLRGIFEQLKHNGAYKNDSDILRYLYTMYVRQDQALFIKYMQLN